MTLYHLFNQCISRKVKLGIKQIKIQITKAVVFIDCLAPIEAVSTAF